MKLSDISVVRRIVEEEDRRKVDRPCRVNEFRIRAKKIGDRNQFALEFKDDTFPMSDWAASQLLQTRLGIPYRFATERCDPGLAEEISERLRSQEQPRAILVRMKREKSGLRVRAVLPGSYHRFDNLDFLDIAEPVADQLDFRAERYRLDEMTFSVRLLSPEAVNAGTTERRDPHHFGVALLNSEVGYLDPQGEVTVVREICSNGLLGISGEPFFRHRRSALAGMSKERLADRFRRGLDEGLQSREEVIETIRNSREASPGTGRGPEVVRIAHRALRLPPRNLPVALEAHTQEVEGGAATAFTVASSLTRAARHLSIEDAIRYERAAWNYLRWRTGGSDRN